MTILMPPGSTMPLVTPVPSEAVPVIVGMEEYGVLFTGTSIRAYGGAVSMLTVTQELAELRLFELSRARDLNW